jgi:small nuclear ribonucleoprotein (snRNP)-like protein
MNKKFIHKIIYAPCKILKEALVALGVMFGLYQGIAVFIPNFVPKITGWHPLLVFFFVSIIWGRCWTWKRRQINFKIPNTNTTIEVLFGDLFKQEGMRVIPVNEFFDSEIGTPVSETSLHGIFINKCLGGHSSSFDEEVGKQLTGVQSTEVLNKPKGKNKSYSIGTTVVIRADNIKYLAFALAKTRPDTCKAYCDVATMWIALNGLWMAGRNICNGSPINLPLVGSGQSGVGLPARDLLNLIILSAITETKKERITSKIKIILQDNYFEELDLQDIKRYWEE